MNTRFGLQQPYSSHSKDEGILDHLLTIQMFTQKYINESLVIQKVVIRLQKRYLKSYFIEGCSVKSANCSILVLSKWCYFLCSIQKVNRDASGQSKDPKCKKMLQKISGSHELLTHQTPQQPKQSQTTINTLRTL